MEDKKEKLPSTRIQWYPGHMAKTKRQIETDIKLVDIVIEILDARIPISSQNPDLKTIIKNKKKIVILNKSDLAEERENSKWLNYFKNKKIPTILCNSKNGKGIEKIGDVINSLMEDERAKLLQKGRTSKITRVMIVGIPNVGKSSFINRISKGVNATVGNKPGVTRQKQWIRLINNIELLDTPGVLWPRQENAAMNLAYTGTIKSEILEETEIAYELMKYLIENYRPNIINTYRLKPEEVTNILLDKSLADNEKIVEVIKLIGKNRGAINKGGNIDFNRASKIILDDFKNGRLGRITLEKIEQ